MPVRTPGASKAWAARMEILGCTVWIRPTFPTMKCAHAWSVPLLLAALVMVGGCTRPASGASQPRGAEPGMAAPLPADLSRDSKSYLANDPP